MDPYESSHGSGELTQVKLPNDQRGALTPVVFGGQQVLQVKGGD